MPEKKTSNFFKNKINRALIFLIIILAALVIILIFMPGRKQQVERSPAPTQKKEPVVYENIPTATPLITGKQAVPAEKTGTSMIKGRIAVVIDDAGNSSLLLKPFLQSAVKLTIAVLPGLPHSAESARLAAAAGKEVILHLPMEAINGNNTGPGAVFTYNSDDEILQTLADDFTDISQARGVNNHMGSRATTDPRVMDTVMHFLKDRGKFFLDSKTAPSSVPGDTAREYGVPYLSRDVFLDNETDKDYIRKQFRETVDISVAAGQAVAIGHVQHTVVMEVINEFLPELEKKGIELVFVSELL